jgi:polyhydroxyalkanoate synthase
MRPAAKVARVRTRRKKHPIGELFAPLRALAPALEKTEAELARIVDPFGVGRAFASVEAAWLQHPEVLVETLGKFACDLQSLQLNAWYRMLGVVQTDQVRAAPDDDRFVDPAWTELAPYDLVKQFYLLYTRWLQNSLYETPGVSQREKRRATFWARQWLNAVAPTNWLATNPVAVRKFWESGGTSLVAGLKNFLADLREGDVRMVDTSRFVLGGNVANSPGAVVFRNELLEVIHYAATTDRVHAMPIVLVAPWINKFYILDLNEKKSLIRYLVGRGFSVFVTSWKNPDAEAANATFDDYMLRGVLQAIEVAREVCSAKQVHAVGYCLGGTALAALMAWLNREHVDAADVPVAHWSLFATLVDFSRPGAIEAYIDEDSVASIVAMMSARGYLDSREMGRAFRTLRSNSLIWHYFVHGYLYGETPPAFDVLYWNTDGTRLPRAMHAWYLNELYLKNRLIEMDALTLGGHPIDLARIRQPLYAVGCEEDHIAPWKATFSIGGRIAAPIRYTLASSGHILGIVNPPVKPPKRWYWTGVPRAGESAVDWHERQEKHAGSWWDDWGAWLAKHCGEVREPPPLATAQHPQLAPAPGTYVREK